MPRTASLGGLTVLASILATVAPAVADTNVLPLTDFSSNPSLTTPPWTTATDKWFILPSSPALSTWWDSTNQRIQCLTTPSGTKKWNQVLTPKFNVDASAYYKVTFNYTLQSGRGLIGFDGANPNATWGLWGANTRGSNEKVLYPDWTCVFPATNGSFTWYTRARDNAIQSNARFECVDDGTSSNLYVDNVKVDKVSSRSDIAAWANANYAAFPASSRAVLNNFQWPANRANSLQRTLAKLRSGQQVTIAFFGDSLACDCGDSYLDVLLESKYASQIRIVNAVGSGTSMKNWLDAVNNVTNPQLLNFTDALVNQQPDLVIMPGITLSSSGNSTDVSAVRTMIDNVRNAVNAGYGYTPDILLTAVPSRNPVYASSSWSPTVVDDYNPATGAASNFRNSLYHLSIEKNTGFMDLEGACGLFMQDFQNTGNDYTTLFRDGYLHLDNQGKALAGQAMLSFLSVPEPGSSALLLSATLTTLLRRPRKK
jgi:hypothetical protein